MHTQVQSKTLKGRDHRGDLIVDERIMLNQCHRKKSDMWMLTKFIWSRIKTQKSKNPVILREALFLRTWIFVCVCVCVCVSDKMADKTQNEKGVGSLIYGNSSPAVGWWQESMALSNSLSNLNNLYTAYCNKCHYRVDSTSASYLEDPEFIYRPQTAHPLRFFVAFLSPFRQMPQ
jgi:hypothetical protein